MEPELKSTRETYGPDRIQMDQNKRPIKMEGCNDFVVFFCEDSLVGAELVVISASASEV